MSVTKTRRVVSDGLRTPAWSSDRTTEDPRIKKTEKSQCSAKSFVAPVEGVKGQTLQFH